MEEENPANTNFFFCNICRIYCASALNLQTHFLGNKHKAVEEALKAHGIVKPLSASTSSSGSGEVLRLPQSLPDYVDTETEKSLEKTLEEHLNSCKDTEPAIGLQYILEYRSQNNPIYECNLCTHQGGVTNMFMHVLGIKHRMAYLKKHHPDLADVKGRGSKLVLRLKEVAAKVEEEEGRQRIRTTMDCPVLTDDIYTEEFSDSLITWFTEEDEGKGKKKEDPKPEAKEMDKKAEEASEAKGDDSNKSEDKKEPEQNTVQQFVDIDSDSDEFTTNEGLLKYLKSFEIIDEDDAAFILKVTQKLTDALILYREKASERKQAEESDSGSDDASDTETEPTPTRVMLLKESSQDKEEEDKQDCNCHEFINVKMPIYMALNKFYELGVLESDYVTPSKRRSAMNSVTMAAVYAVVDLCFKEKLFNACEGCVIDACGQKSHVCLTWTDEFHNQALKDVCSKLRVEPILYIMMVVACSIRCFSMNKKHVANMAKYIYAISCSDNPQYILNNQLLKCDKRILDLVKNVIKDRDYKSFQIHCDRCKHRI